MSVHIATVYFAFVKLSFITKLNVSLSVFYNKYSSAIICVQSAHSCCRGQWKLNRMVGFFFHSAISKLELYCSFLKENEIEVGKCDFNCACK